MKSRVRQAPPLGLSTEGRGPVWRRVFAQLEVEPLGHRLRFPGSRRVRAEWSMEWAGPGSAPSKCWARQRLGGEACVNGAGPRTWAGPGGAVSEAKCGRGRGGAGPEAGLRRAAGLSLRSLAAPLGPHVQKA